LRGNWVCDSQDYMMCKRFWGGGEGKEFGKKASKRRERKKTRRGRLEGIRGKKKGGMETLTALDQGLEQKDLD